MSKYDTDPDTRAHHKRQDSQHEESQSKYQSDLAENTHGDALAALWGKNRKEPLDKTFLRSFEKAQHDLFIFLNSMYVKYRDSVLSSAAIDIHNIKLSNFLPLQPILDEIKAVETSLKSCSLTEFESNKINRLLIEMEDSAEEFHLLN